MSSDCEVLMLEIIIHLSYQHLVTAAAPLGYVCCTSAAVSAQLLSASRKILHHVIQVSV